VTDVQMLEKSRYYSKAGLTQVADAVYLPTDKVHQQNQKLINDRKAMFFDTNKLDWEWLSI
jgi:2-oxoglutarate dehydrogenase E1 component